MGVINSGKIAKNTLALYIRMGFSMVVSLFTSRITLNALGVEDFGVFNVVAGVIALFSFLNTSMSSATSRFLTLELGKEGQKGLSKLFSISLFTHFCIGILIVLIMETFGLWMLNTQLVIPQESMLAANWVFQFSIISCVISICAVPFSALIIADERMGFFAKVEITNVCLKLLLIISLNFVPINKLFFLGFISLLMTIVTTSIYILYDLRHFKNCRFKFVKDFNSYKQVLTFSGWDLFGHLSGVARTQGVSILLNMFWGTLANAASGISGAIQGAVNSFSTNVMTAVKPQIIKSYASEEYSGMMKLIYSACRLIFSLLLLISLPILIETEFILNLWLGQVPEFAVGFTRLAILFVYCSMFSSIVVTGVHATGDLKKSSLINGLLYISVFPVTYIGFKFFNGSIYIPALYNAIVVLGGGFVNFFALKRYLKTIKFSEFFNRVVLKCAFATLLSSIIPLVISNFVEPSIVRFIIITIVSIVSVAFISYFFTFNMSEKNFVNSYMLKLITKLGIMKRSYSS